MNDLCKSIDIDLFIKIKLTIVDNKKLIKKYREVINECNNGFVKEEKEYYNKSYRFLLDNEYCSKKNKIEAVKNYMNVFDKENYYEKLKKNKKSKMCDLCKSSKLKNVLDGLYECMDCTHVNYFNIDKVKDNSKVIKVNKYQRGDYFIDYIRKFLMKKIPTNIDKKFFDKLKKRIKSDGIKDFKKITPNLLDKYLKKMKKTSFTYYKSFILMQLNGTPPPYINSEDLGWMQNMFREVELAWNEIKSTDEYSFPFYPFCIYKILELGGDYDEYLQYWKLTDNHENMKNLNEIWKKICDKRNFEYIKTYIE